MGSGERTPVERVALVGFMASGKTTVGRTLARLLEWSFRDFDDAIEDREGASISEIFRDRGEEHFRDVEAAVGRRLLQRREVVLATGGGWGADPARLEGLPPGTLSVWLQVSPEEAVRRIRSDGGSRPLLETEDPVGRAREILAGRKAAYRRASLWLDSEAATPDELARRILETVRERNDPRSVPDAEPV